jgi:flagellar basal body-associated protein FliL
VKPAARRLNWLWLALIALPALLIVAGLAGFFWLKATRGEVQPKWRQPAGTNAVSPAP